MRKGVKNIIFDMGNVIIDFDPDVFMDRAQIEDKSDRELIRKEIYNSPMWVEMDMGNLDEKGMCELVKQRLPEHLHRHLEDLICRWCDPLIMIKGIDDLVFDLKKAGYNLYLLSNASVMQKQYWPNVKCSICFDGVVVSAFEHLIKPDERIYRLLLERYELKANECLFIDDRIVNTDAAAKLGIDTFHFENDTEKLREYIFG